MKNHQFGQRALEDRKRNLWRLLKLNEIKEPMKTNVLNDPANKRWFDQFKAEESNENH